MCKRIAVVLALVAILGISTLAQATVITYTANTANADPTSQGWTADVSHALSVSGGTDTKPYWEINTPGNYGEYVAHPSAADMAGDWTAKALLEAPTLSSQTNDAEIYVADGSKYYTLGLSTGGVGSGGGVTLSFTPSTSQYYELKLQKVSGVVTAYLDSGRVGVVPGVAAPGYYSVIFGDDATGDSTSVSRWNSVTFATGVDVPEPATLVLLATGMIGLLAYAWRKRK